MNIVGQQLALIPLIEAANQLGFDTSKKFWRVGFHRFLKRSRLPVVRLSARRFRVRPEVITAYIARHEIGNVRSLMGVQTNPREEAA